MTSRRSLKTDGSRSSRAFQFIPGHVGGRVDSAQPVRRRNTVGSMKRPPATLPDELYTFSGSSATTPNSATTDSYTLPTPGARVLSAVGIFGSSSHTDVVLPSGWTVITEGSYGSSNGWGGKITKYVVAQAAGRTFGLNVSMTGQEAGSGSYRTSCYAAAYLSGDSGLPGNWTAVPGEFDEGYSTAFFGDAGTAPIWFQLGIVTGVYTVGTPPVGMTNDGALCGSYYYPGSGTYSGATLTAKMAAPLEERPNPADRWDYGNIGAYGNPCSVNFGCQWSP